MGKKKTESQSALIPETKKKDPDVYSAERERPNTFFTEEGKTRLRWRLGEEKKKERKAGIRVFGGSTVRSKKKRKHMSGPKKKKEEVFLAQAGKGEKDGIANSPIARRS